jgi:hypothetical protein
MAFHGKPLYTGDLDVLVDPSTQNAPRVLAALREFGVPSYNLAETDLLTWGTTLTFGVPPKRIDVQNWLSGLTWEDAASDSVEGDLGGVPVRFLSLRAWRLNKTAADRDHDREDLKKLT